MSRRPIAVVVLLVLLGGGLALSRAEAAAEPEAPVVEATNLLPVGPPDGALDAAWYCAGQSAGADTAADGTLVLANAGDDDARARVTVTSSEGDEATLAVDVPALTTERVALTDVMEADWVAAQVHVVGGTVVVEHEIVGPHGRDVAPCHSRSAERWYLPAGASTRDATMALALYNPHAGAATVDLSFTTDENVREPNDLQGMLVPAGGVVVVPVSDIVTEREVLATTVVARRGLVVVDRIQVFDGSGAATTEEEIAAQPFRREGLTLTPALAQPGLVWQFPASVSSAVTAERVVVFNPGERTAEVELVFALDEPERYDPVPSVPLDVPAGRFSVYDVADNERLPESAAHTLTVRSRNDVPVVAERSLSSVGDTATLGEAASTGSPVGAPTWVFAAGPRAGGDDDARYVLTNPGREAAVVTVSAFGDGTLAPIGDEPVTLEPGARIELRPEDLGAGRTSLLIDSTSPVVVERRLLSRTPAEEAPALGTSATIGIPLDRRLSLLD